jgi:hypothetical protein
VYVRQKEQVRAWGDDVRSAVGHTEFWTMEPSVAMSDTVGPSSLMATITRGSPLGPNSVNEGLGAEVPREVLVRMARQSPSLSTSSNRLAVTVRVRSSSSIGSVTISPHRSIFLVVAGPTSIHGQPPGGRDEVGSWTGDVETQTSWPSGSGHRAPVDLSPTLAAEGESPSSARRPSSCR